MQLSRKADYALREVKHLSKLPKGKLPFDISIAIAFDKGEMLKDNLGCFLKLSRSGIL